MLLLSQILYPVGAVSGVGAELAVHTNDLQYSWQW